MACDGQYHGRPSIEPLGSRISPEYLLVKWGEVWEKLGNEVDLRDVCWGSTSSQHHTWVNDSQMKDTGSLCIQQAKLVTWMTQEDIIKSWMTSAEPDIMTSWMASTEEDGSNRCYNCAEVTSQHQDCTNHQQSDTRSVQHPAKEVYSINLSSHMCGTPTWLLWRPEGRQQI